MKINFVDEIVRDSFGLWISALFSAIGSWNPEFSFEQRKEAFLFLVEHLLITEKIKFIKPGADCYVSPKNPHPRLSISDELAHWDLDAKEIVACLRNAWPGDVNSECDEELTVFFYEIPAVIWIDEHGGFCAS